jgi:hypothetical protein
MSLLLPLDDNGNPIQVIGFLPRGTQKLLIGAASTRLPTPLDAKVQLVTLIATGPCRFAIGDDEVTADLDGSPFLYPGIYVDVPLRNNERQIAFIAEAEDCVVYVIGRD